MKTKSRSLLKSQRNIETQNACIWEDLDNLAPFLHPKYKAHFRFMAMQQVNGLAKELDEKIKESKSKRVLSIDSGSRPLVRIMKHFMNSKYAWRTVKCPRVFPSNVANYVLFYLSEKEKKSGLSQKQKEDLQKFGQNYNLDMNIENLINFFAAKFNTAAYRKQRASIEQVISLLTARKSIYFEIFNVILRNTAFARFIRTEFVLLDEYVTSGATLLSTHLFLSLFNITVRYKLITYYFNLGKKSKPDFLFYSKYYKDDLPGCYYAGIYPFENRLDIIGSFYHLTEEDICFRTNASLISSTSASKQEVFAFLSHLNDLLIKNNLIAKVKRKLKYKDVRNYNTAAHMIRYLLYLLEANPVLKDFYEQYFEMYAPIWSPLPLDYHINFAEAYKQSDRIFLGLIRKHNIAGTYKIVRKQLLNMIVENMSRRRLK